MLQGAGCEYIISELEVRYYARLVGSFHGEPGIIEQRIWGCSRGDIGDIELDYPRELVANGPCEDKLWMCLIILDHPLASLDDQSFFRVALYRGDRAWIVRLY